MSPLLDKSIIKIFARAGTIGFHMVISTFVGLAIGYGIDRFFNTSPWFTIIFLVLGIVRRVQRARTPCQKDFR